MAAGEIYVQLCATFADDPKLLRLARWPKDARGARDLYVQMLCYCKLNMTDGRVPREVLGKLAYPDTIETAERQAGLLREVGLIEPVEGDWFVTAFLRRNPSRAAIEAKSERRRADSAASGRYGSHVRWHEKTGIVEPTCEYCCPSDGVGPCGPDGVDPSSPNGVEPIKATSAARSDTDDTKTKTEAGTESKSNAPETDDRAADRSVTFDDFWTAYPRRVGKDEARRQWEIALKRKVDPVAILAGAVEYAAKVKRDRTEERFIAYPSNWLGRGRWDDELAIPVTRRRATPWNGEA